MFWDFAQYFSKFMLLNDINTKPAYSNFVSSFSQVLKIFVLDFYIDLPKSNSLKNI